MKAIRYGCVRLVFLTALVLHFASPLGAAERDLRISSWKLPFNVHVMRELEEGGYERTFSEYHVSAVNLQTGPKLMAALAAGDLDIVQGIGDAAFLVAIAGGIDARIVAVNSRSPRAFAVVARRGIANVSDLQGKKVAGLRGSVVHQVLVDALAEVGMTEADVEFYPMPIAQAASTLLAGRTDAALLVGAEILRAQRAGASVVADGAGRVAGLSLVVASTSFLEKNPDIVGRFFAMRERTLAELRANPSATVVAVSEELRIAPENVEVMMGWYDFAPQIDEADIASLRKTQEYLLREGIVARSIDLRPLLAK